MRNRRCALRAVLILMLLAVPCGLVCTIRAESIPHNVVLAFVEMDAPFVGHAFREPALARFWELASQFDACRLGNREEDAAINCLRTVINGEDAMSVAGNASSLRESTLTGLLLGNRGSCAALVALEARLHLNYGTFLLERGRLDEARKQLKLAVRDAPKSADGWTNLGVAHARLGKIDRARDCFERALKLEPGNQTARTNLAAITSTTNGRTKPQ